MAIARALANEPLIVLADEPTGNLDSAATLDVLRLFENLHAAGQTLVIVTHDERIAATAGRLISMRDGAFVGETRLTGGTRGHLGAPASARAFPSLRSFKQTRSKSAPEKPPKCPADQLGNRCDPDGHWSPPTLRTSSPWMAAIAPLVSPTRASLPQLFVALLMDVRSGEVLRLACWVGPSIVDP